MWQYFNIAWFGDILISLLIAGIFYGFSFIFKVSNLSDRHTKIPYNIAFNSSENNPTEENLKKLKKVVDKQSYIAYNQSSGTDRAKKKQF